MGGIRRLLAGIFAFAVLGALTFVAMPQVQADVTDDPVVTGQTISLEVSGPRGGTRSGDAAGREPMKITKGIGGLTAVSGSAEFLGATVSVDVRPLLGFLPIYFGTIRHDFGTGSVSTPVLFGQVSSSTSSPDEETHVVRATWLDFSSFPWSTYTVQVGVTTHRASPAEFCLSQVRSVEIALEAYNARIGVYPGGAADQVVPVGPVSAEDAAAMLGRLIDDKDPEGGPQTASIKLLGYLPPSAGRDTGLQTSVPDSGTDLPFVTLTVVATGESTDVDAEGWGVVDDEVVGCSGLPGYDPSGSLAVCKSMVRTVEIALESYNARIGTYPGGADDELPPAGPVSEVDADAILGRLLADEDAQPGKPWTAKVKLLKNAPDAATLDNAGGADQVSLPNDAILEQYDGNFVALEYVPANPPPVESAEMIVYGFYTQTDGGVQQLKSCET